MSYSDTSVFNLCLEDQKCLLSLARKSILYGLKYQMPLPIELNEFSSELQTLGASFVTLHIQDKNTSQEKLRGCIGTLQAHRPLVLDVVEHAYAAAFQDHRFNPVEASEVDQLTLEISVLEPEQEITCNSREELLATLEPFKDGLIIEDGFRKATFLPSVWQQLPNKSLFLDHLLSKAGLPTNHWSEQTKAFRYQTFSFDERNFSK